MEDEKIYLSEEGYLNLQEEIKILKTEKRDEIAERLKIAKEFGDLSENSEYDEAKHAQESNETKIAQLEETLKNSEILNKKIGTSKVQIGNTVSITNLKTNSEKEYRIVGAPEANLAENKISNVSPLGQALIGNKKGDVITVEAPVGIIEYKINKIGLN